jgi:oxygen-independent coproporphyrinogen-3 oxidase
MVEWACERLETASYGHYEISNWGKRVDGNILSCRHNLQYWRNLPYFGFGAGAHGYVNGVRTANLRGVKVYIQSMDKDKQAEFPADSAVETALHVDRWTAMQEHMMMGLRLLEEGVSNSGFHQRFGVTLKQAFPGQIQRLEHIGLLEWAGEGRDSLRLTRRGWLLGNRVFSEFVDVEEPAGLL